jgi:hypothetical protein
MSGKLKSVGFFRELRHGDADGPSLKESIRPQPHPDTASMIAYLQGGHVIATTGARVHDALDPSKKYIAVLGVATDGAWIWSTDLSYYVATYNVILPDEFIDHMQRLRWQAPTFTEAQVSELCKLARNRRR